MKKLCGLILGLPMLVIADSGINVDADGYMCFDNQGVANVTKFCINIQNYNADTDENGAAVTDIWVKYLFNSPQNGIDMIVDQMAINCTEGTSAIIHEIDYLEGNVVNDTPFSTGQWNFESNAPGTIAADIQNFVCDGDLAQISSKFNALNS